MKNKIKKLINSNKWESIAYMIEGTQFDNILIRNAIQRKSKEDLIVYMDIVVYRNKSETKMKDL